MRILFTDAATVAYQHDVSLRDFEQFGEIVAYDRITREELLQEAPTVEVILCNKTVIDREVMTAAPNLRYIGLFATGYNNIDVVCAQERGVTVCNAGSYSTAAVAQQVFAYLLSHFSKVEPYTQFVQSGGWKASDIFWAYAMPTDELMGKTIGIVGYGSIGKEVEKIARAFSMHPIVCARTVRPNGQTEFVSFEELLAQSDIITVHCPLTDQTNELFHAGTFAKMKDGAFFVNTSRGGVVDETALRDALQSGKLSGAGIDVLTEEPMRTDCVLYQAPNLLITPHTAWAPLSTRKRLVAVVRDNLDAYLKGSPQNAVVKP
ncbi:MAG: D-2-hydroxyacid dehydrogenase [Clostridia bacterium]|nr:D-2-hydroxyacid dehydrogenase [Clostridia bacterium]